MKNYFKAVTATILEPLTLRSALVALIFFVIAGPFGTFQALTFSERIGFFVPLFLLSLPIAGIVCHWAHTRFSHLMMPLQRLIAMGFFVAFFSPVLHWYNRWFAGDDPLQNTALWYSFLLMAGVAFAIVAVLTVVDLEAARRQDAEPSDIDETPSHPKPTPVATVKPRLMSRLTNVGTAEIARITVEDHYVQVFLDDGRQERLLMRFADAVSEMDTTPGFVTHRSHWVASDKVEGIVREDGRDYVQLVCGTRVPLSRGNRPSVMSLGIKEVA